MDKTNVFVSFLHLLHYTAVYWCRALDLEKMELKSNKEVSFLKCMPLINILKQIENDF